ncbi:hypothetical protein GOODEAATRI_017528 [Goodea atripinnis]|uniref:P-type ATPase C-terminal domain-containing protein n=1 Tax=Goodea atripinnis TaxID=208336 RepID=A0ABV0PYT3_9TELE
MLLAAPYKVYVFHLRFRTGCTGIVDRLQEDVPETIEALQEAGVKVWILTGDKQETAINIANACKLLRSSDRLLSANCGSRHEEEREESSLDSTSSFILVIDGRTLEWALQEELKGSFLELSCKCKAVICCRSTPLQKSKVVQLIRDKIGVMTLAVGDGANDVSMIQVADVGIGISGQEGMQAVMSSDFAISRFKHLKKLLLVHGHWCYHRLANMILYFIYKNVVRAMYVNLLFWYQFFCGYSGSVMINSWVLILFNLVFTSVPPLIYGILDQDTPADTLMKLPELYGASRTTKECLGRLSDEPCCVYLLQTWIHMLVLVLSAALYFGFVQLYSAFCVVCSHPTNLFGVETLQITQPLFYIICTLTTVAALLPRYQKHSHRVPDLTPGLTPQKQLTHMMLIRRGAAVGTVCTIFHVMS